ncbi:MAG: hypothetical protein JNG88_04510 [Phycisphaerales bacterium]|nr:hypothetical protein [Phycisphaerales bacterium]
MKRSSKRSGPVIDESLAADLIARPDAFGDTYLNDDYKELCRKMAKIICTTDSPVNSGKLAGWAAGVVHALGRVNFLTDPGTTPHLRSEEIARGFGVSMATMHAKARVLRESLGLMPFHPDWCLPALLEKNPLVWMLKVNGMIVDIRGTPREAQEVAYEKGLIPYIPADRKSASCG